LEDLIDIDGFKDDMEDDGLSNKLLGESFYFILLLLVYNYLDYIDFFISIRFEGVRKGVMAVIAAISVMVGTLLVATAETVATLETRLDQIGLSKGAGSTLNFKIRFYNDIIVIKESGDIDIIVLNDKVAMLGTTTLEVL